MKKKAFFSMCLIALLVPALLMADDAIRHERIKREVQLIQITPTAKRIQVFQSTFGIAFSEVCGTGEPCRPKHPMVLGEFLRKVGPPEKAYAMICCTPHIFDEGVTLIYVRHGFEVTAHRPANYFSDYPINATADMEIDRVVFGLFPPWGTHVWQGFGPVNPIND